VVGGLCPRAPDLALVDALARLGLVAQRACWTVCLRGGPADLQPLRELLGYLGLDDIVDLDEVAAPAPRGNGRRDDTRRFS
jgi:hypothetical protein